MKPSRCICDFSSFGVAKNSLLLFSGCVHGYHVYYLYVQERCWKQRFSRKHFLYLLIISSMAMLMGVTRLHAFYFSFKLRDKCLFIPFIKKFCVNTGLLFSCAHFLFVVKFFQKFKYLQQRVIFWILAKNMFSIGSSPWYALFFYIWPTTLAIQISIVLSNYSS